MAGEKKATTEVLKPKKENRKCHCIRINRETSDWLKRHGGLGPMIERMVLRCRRIEFECSVRGEEVDLSEFFDLTCRRFKKN